MMTIEDRVSKAIETLEAYDERRRGMTAGDMETAGEGTNDWRNLTLREMIVVLRALGYKPA